LAAKKGNWVKTNQGIPERVVAESHEPAGARSYPAARFQAETHGLETTPLPAPLFRPAAPAWQRALYLPLTILAWLAIGIIVLWLLGHATHALVLVVLAVVVAFAMAPLVALFRRWIHRPVAIAFAYILGVAILLGAGTLLVTTAAGQVINLVANLPQYLNHVQGLGAQALVFLRPLGVTNTDIQDFTKQILAEFQVAGGALAASSLALVSRVASILLDSVLVLMLSIYFTLDGERAVTWLREKTPDNFRRYVRYFLAVVNHVVGGYVRGTLTMALLIGVLVGLGLYFLTVPYAVLLGVLAFFMEFVPVVGVLISGAISLLVTLPSGLGHTALVLAYFIFVHVIEGDVIGPRIMGKAVGIHPATGIIALLVGTELFGVWGALFGAPLAGLLQATLVGVWRVRQSDPNDTADIPVVIAGEVKEALSEEEPGET
jgi:predicted PurR-regulated permease PerM